MFPLFVLLKLAKFKFFSYCRFKSKPLPTNTLIPSLSIFSTQAPHFLSMDVDVLLSIKYGGESKLIQIQQSSSHTNIVDQIQGTWVELKGVNVGLRFSVGTILNCCLDSDVDLKNMLLMCQHTGEKIVFVEVNRLVSGSSSRVSPPNSQNSQSSTPNTSVAADLSLVSYDNNNKDHVAHNDMGDLGSILYYEMCPAAVPKSFLSDQWLEIFKDGVGTKFPGGAIEFRKELIKYSTRLGFTYRYARNESRYVHAVCDGALNNDCKWYIKAKQQGLQPNFVVYKACFNHNCMGTLVNQNQTRLGSRIVGDLVVNKVRAKPTLTVKEVVTDFHQHYGVELSYSKAWRSVEIARDEIFGSYEDSYDHLRWYCEAIQRTNPGSIVVLEKSSEDNKFERLFIAFRPCIDGFRTCRPMLFIDGTFMKGRAKGTLLSATAKDGNDGLYPVAFAVVSAETTDNWSWFLAKLRDGVHHDKQIFYLYDRNTGLMAAFSQVFDRPVHFFCMYHLMQNLKGRFSIANLVDHFKDCAYAPNPRVFSEKLAVFKEVGGEGAAQWIDELPVKKWAVAFAPNLCRYGEMTSNAAESFNAWIREDRALPITYMIDSIRKKIGRWYVDRRDDSAKWTGALCPKQEALWNKLSDIGKSYLVQKFAEGRFEVTSKITVSIDLKLKICTCYRWQIEGFPCTHAVAVIRRYCDTIYGHIDEAFLAKNYRECYKDDINPIPQTERFECQAITEDDKVVPPHLNRPAGRPKKKRVSSFGEWPRKKPFSCTRCGKSGRHDPITCAIEPKNLDDAFEEENH